MNNFEDFKNELLNDIKNNKKSCLQKIEANQGYVIANIGEEGDRKMIDKFVDGIINSLFIAKKYSMFEKFLKHPLIYEVHRTFRNSKVLIEACKRNDKNVLKWLITMNINPCVQDENGMTALMYASKVPEQLFVVKYLITKPECLNLVDKNGENAVFHALKNTDSLAEILKTDIDVNCRNNNNEEPLMYCCKYDIFNAIGYLVQSNNINVNTMDKAERTPAMILTEKGRYNEIILLRKRRCDFNFKNRNNECVLSILINKMYLTSNDLFSEYIRIIVALVFSDCNFNIPIDEEGNTAFMIFMAVQDWYSVYFIAKGQGNRIDLSVKNNFGENATSLFIKNGSYNNSIYEAFINNRTFDFEYVDSNNNNNLLMLSAMKEPKLVNTIIENNVNFINCVNSRNENALILATKFNNEDAVKNLLKIGIYVNQQDYLGNNALYYAVNNKNFNIIKLLLLNGADMNLNNLNGVSPLNHAHSLCDKSLIAALNNPMGIPYTKYEEKFDPMEKYLDTAEYLYPCISSSYPKFKMTYPLECLEKSVYMGNMVKIGMSCY